MKNLNKTRSYFLSVLSVIFLFSGCHAYASSSNNTACSSALLGMLAKSPSNRMKYSCNQGLISVRFTDKNKRQTLQFLEKDLPSIDHRPYYGLAAFYNVVRYYRTSKNHIASIGTGKNFSLNKSQWLAVVGHFKTILINAPGAVGQIGKNKLSLSWPPNADIRLSMTVKPKTNLKALNPDWGDLRYLHLWKPIALLSKWAEWAMTSIHDNVVASWGMSIIIFSLLIKFLLLPASIATKRLQDKASQYQSVLEPQLANIKSKFDGEEAHNRIMQAHKALGITPFYTLRPMLGSLIQIPIIVAIFNTLGEMYQLGGVSFLWIKDLSRPDALFSLPFSIPFFGNTFNLLPVLMLLVTLISTALLKNSIASKIQLKRQKRNLYGMAVVFFILFYPFPAAMVLYWTLTNIMQFIQQQFVSRSEHQRTEVVANG